jgi:hypothetical protein
MDLNAQFSSGTSLLQGQYVNPGLQPVAPPVNMMGSSFVPPFDYNWPLKDAALQMVESLLREEECQCEGTA